MGKENNSSLKVAGHASATNKGKVRQENEDAYTVDEELGLFIVSDGMGGHAEGALASEIVTKELPEIIKEKFTKLRGESTRSLRRLLTKSIKELNSRVLKEARTGEGQEGMGATVIITMVRNDRLFVANVGDSRAYLFRNNKLRQLSIDHTVVAELVEKGHIEPEQSENHPYQHVITQCVGVDRGTKPFVRTLAAKKNDRVLLCSDGLTTVISDEQIRDVLNQQANSESVCNELVKQANEAGGPDNITVIVMDVC